MWFGGGKLAADLTLPRLRSRRRWDASRQGTGYTGPSPAHPRDVHVDQVDATEWTRAAEFVSTIAHKMRATAHDDVAAWTEAAAGTASVLAVFDAASARPELANAVNVLAWSAQHQSPAPRSSRNDHLSGFAVAARLLSHAAQSTGAATAADLAMVLTAVIVVVRLLQGWHETQGHVRQAAALAATAQRLQPLADGAVPDWKRRPYGVHTDTELRQLAARLRAEYRRHSALQERIAALTRAAYASNGPVATALRVRRGVLVAAADAERRLPALQDELRIARADQQQAQSIIDALQQQLGKGRLALRLTGTSREQLTAELQQARTAWAEACARERNAQAAYREQTTIASAPSNTESQAPGTAAAELAELTATWEQRHAQAIDRDVTSAPQRALTRADAASVPLARDATQAAAQLAAIRAELTLRAALPPDLATRENKERAAYHQPAHVHTALPSAIRPSVPRRGQPIR